MNEWSQQALRSCDTDCDKIGKLGAGVECLVVWAPDSVNSVQVGDNNRAKLRYPAASPFAHHCDTERMNSPRIHTPWQGLTSTSCPCRTLADHFVESATHAQCLGNWRLTSVTRSCLRDTDSKVHAVLQLTRNIDHCSKNRASAIPLTRWPLGAKKQGHKAIISRAERATFNSLHVAHFPATGVIKAEFDSRHEQ